MSFLFFIIANKRCKDTFIILIFIKKKDYFDFLRKSIIFRMALPL